MNETLDNLVSVTLLNLAETGYSDSTIAEHRRAYAHLAEFCAANGIPAYDRTVGQSFLDDVVSEKYPPGSKKNLDIRRYMKRLDCTMQRTFMQLFRKLQTRTGSAAWLGIS